MVNVKGTSAAQLSNVVDIPRLTNVGISKAQPGADNAMLMARRALLEVKDNGVLAATGEWGDTEGVKVRPEEGVYT